MENYISSMGLSEKQLEDIRRLEEICGRHEQLNMKLNWDMLKSRSSEKNDDFLYYEDGTLAGFLGLYDVQQKSLEIEITGMVHPDFRSRGIFRKLFKLAKQKCMEINAQRLLLISERGKTPGIKFMESVGGRYSFSEYRMNFEGNSLPDIRRSGIELRKAEKNDYSILKSLDRECFDEPEETADQEAKSGYGFPEDLYKDTFIALLDGEVTGKIGLMKEDRNGYIFGFGVKSELQGRGYGREILCLGIEKLLNEKAWPITLEVALENERALSLYKSCGFNMITVYDYYELLI